MFRASKLMRDAMGRDLISPGSRLRIARPLDAESLVGRHEGSGRPTSSGADSLSKKLHQRVGSARAIAKAFRTKRSGRRGGFQFDARQRAVVKLHYFAHGGGGAAALGKHIKYIGRDAVLPERQLGLPADAGKEAERQSAPARSSERPQHWAFYDADSDKVNAVQLAEAWGRQDRRHFRIILSAENGARIGDLRSFTREVMARAEAALGDKLEWFAADHFDTDNPHTHIVLRGRRVDGRDLVIPRDFVQHGFRNAARDAATARLGPRTRDDERQALQREALAHRPTRLDAIIAGQLDEAQRVRIAELRAPNGSPDMENALRARAHELKRLGLAVEERRNVLRFEPGWRDALKAMEMHLDIRKSLMQARTQDAARRLADPSRQPSKGLRLPFGLGL
jgi:type IV secretory pathway VirD2 relaxase